MGGCIPSKAHHQPVLRGSRSREGSGNLAVCPAMGNGHVSFHVDAVRVCEPETEDSCPREEQGLADRRVIVRVKARIADGVPGPGLWESGFGEVGQTRPACGLRV